MLNATTNCKLPSKKKIAAADDPEIAVIYGADYPRAAFSSSPESFWQHDILKWAMICRYKFEAFVKFCKDQCHIFNCST